MPSLVLHITTKSTVGIELLEHLKRQKLMVHQQFDAKTLDPLTLHVSWICRDTGTYLRPDQISHYCKFGDCRVTVSDQERHVLLGHDDWIMTELVLVGFKPLSALKLYHQIRTSLAVGPDDSLFEGSTVALGALTSQMRDLGKFAVAKLVYSRHKFRMVALIPTNKGGLDMIFLPFANDIRRLCLENSDIAIDDEVQDAKALVSASGDLESLNLPDPGLAKFIEVVRALEEIEQW
jgi:ATP-dependent DNA helicase 2 subunit 1